MSLRIWGLLLLDTRLLCVTGGGCGLTLRGGGGCCVSPALVFVIKTLVLRYKRIKFAEKIAKRMEIDVIAHIETDFPSKFGIPRQSMMVEALEGRIVFEPRYRNRDSVRGLEAFDYLWLLWDFSKAHRDGASYSPTVRPPRLGGNTRVGVWATRSPFRPNNIGLSCVRLLGVDTEAPDGPILRVGGVDMVSGTPILDIKPYLPYTDAHPAARAGFTMGQPHREGELLDVEMDDSLLDLMPPQKAKALSAVLAADPRPRYQDDAARVYGMTFAGVEVKFKVAGRRLYAWGERK